MFLRLVGYHRTTFSRNFESSLRSHPDVKTPVAVGARKLFVVRIWHLFGGLNHLVGYVFTSPKLPAHICFVRFVLFASSDRDVKTHLISARSVRILQDKSIFVSSLRSYGLCFHVSEATCAQMCDRVFVVCK